MKWYHKLLIKIIKAGEIPRSLAIIMDGNRRFATKLQRQKHEGHQFGLKKVQQVVEWACQMGIQELTLYAFSRDNFKRSKIEVDTLMNLVKKQFARMAQQGALLQKHEVRVRFLGQISLFEVDVQEVLHQIERDTKKNDKLFMNICMGYSSVHEIGEAMIATAKDLVEEAEIRKGGKKERESEEQEKQDRMKHIKAQFQGHLYCGINCKPDLVIRSSGEKRLSNFLLYQSDWSQYCFVQSLWPEFSLWDFVKAVIHYQKHVGTKRRIEAMVRGDSRE